MESAKLYGRHTAVMRDDPEVDRSRPILRPHQIELLIPGPIAHMEHLLDRTAVGANTMFTATFSGANFTDHTYFDIRFRSLDNGADQVAMDCQQGLSAPHGAAVGTPKDSDDLYSCQQQFLRDVDRPGGRVLTRASLHWRSHNAVLPESG